MAISTHWSASALAMQQRKQIVSVAAVQCLLLLLLLACVPALAQGLPADRTLYRSQAKRWRTAEDAAQRSSKSSVKQFLEQHGQVGDHAGHSVVPVKSKTAVRDKFTTHLPVPHATS